MDPKRCRYEVRKAEKLGDRIRFERSSARSRADFFNLYNAFLGWKKYARPLTRRRYENYLRVSDVLVAYVDDVPVVAHLLVIDRAARRVRLVFSASTRFREGPSQKLSGPSNRWLHWQEFLLYQAEGYTSYDFGGGTGASAVGRFKRSFGGEVEMGSRVVVSGALVRPALRIAEWTQRELRRRRPSRAQRSPA
jgi:hypothetical protein